MSLPVTTFYCTQCDFRDGNADAWGLKEYVLPNRVRLPINRQRGWCDECRGLACVEVLSEDDRLKDLQEAERELAAYPERPVRSWWQLHWFILGGRWRRCVEAWERAQFDLLCSLDDANDGLTHLRQRNNPPRCLACGSSQVRTPLVLNQGPWEDKERPKATGFIHPDCGGELWMIVDGLRVRLQPSVRRYTVEGEFIEKEFIESYTSVCHEFFRERAVSNARARGREILTSIAKPGFIEALLQKAE